MMPLRGMGDDRMQLRAPPIRVSVSPGHQPESVSQQEATNHDDEGLPYQRVVMNGVSGIRIRITRGPG